MRSITSAVFLIACTVSSEVLAAEPEAISTPPALKPALAAYCENVERTARRPEFARIPPADRATVVIATVNEKSPGLEDLFKKVGALPPAQRLSAIKASFSKALDREWTCAKFDELWNLK
jgi:hypothetical protein